MKILIGIPLYNEQAYLSECIHSLYDFLDRKCRQYNIEVFLVDDASTDRSQAIYETLEEQFPFNYIRHEDGPRGYGNTILTLFQHAKEKFDVLITFDADLQHAPFTIKEIIEIMEEKPDLDLVSTSRYLSYRFWEQNTPVPIDRYVTNMFLSNTINKCFNLSITDCFCGLKGYLTNKLPEKLDDAGYAFPLIFWNFVAQENLLIAEIETPIIYRLDRRQRGEWKQRIQEYYQKLESVVAPNVLKQQIRKDYKQAVEKLPQIVKHFSNSTIQTYNDFIKNFWITENYKNLYAR